MTVRSFLTLAILMLAVPAWSQIVTKVNAVETSPTHIILPADTSGMVTFRACDGESDCVDVDYKRVRLSANTAFTVDGKAVKYADFRREYAIVKRSQQSYALVMYDTETNLVTRLEIAR